MCELIKRSVDKFRTSDDTLTRVLRNSVWLFTGNGVTAVLSFFYLAILTRTLGPVGFGQFVLIFSTVQIIAAFLRLQTWQTVVHFGARYIAGNDLQKFSSLAFLAITMEILGALIGCLIAWFTIPLIGSYFNWEAGFVEITRLYAIVMLLCFKSSALGILRAHDRFRDGAFAEAMIPIGRMIGALVVLFVGPNVIAFLAAWAAAEILCVTVFWTLIFRHARLKSSAFGIRQFSAIIKENAALLKFYVTTALTDMIGPLREHLVVLVIGFLIDVRSAGLFRLANQLANAVNRIGEIFSKPLFTELSRIYTSGNTKEFRRLFFRSMRLSALSGVAIILLLIALGRPMIDLMAGPEFADAYPLLVLLGCATGFGLIGLGIEPLLQSSGKAHIALAIRFLALASIATGLYFLVPLYNAIGAALSMTIAAAITLMFLLITGLNETRRIKRDQAEQETR